MKTSLVLNENVFNSHVIPFLWLLKSSYRVKKKNVSVKEKSDRERHKRGLESCATGEEK